MNGEKSEQFELWLKGCEINKTELYCLEGEGDTGMYKTQSKRLVGHNYYGDVSTYHVWVAGKNIVSTTNYYDAIGIWNKYGEGHK